ncbi:hypothetical protein KPL71_017122 [Citrus sinensis]|uniref:Uncharacterized protein n=1 Tax=Citrus sinensis TaxID=2711 RepID=A0ACB8JMD3_CITSI|nr:hypothetical protein KPL71_017122 [Citrus sinensis]
MAQHFTRQQQKCPHHQTLSHATSAPTMNTKSVKKGDYAILLDNKLGQTKFDGGYVHNGSLKAARWVFVAECEFLRGLVDRYPNYTLTFAGHSLGAGVVALLVLIVVQNLDKLGNIERNKIRCFAIAPTKCMSLNLAVRYEWIVNGCERKGKTEEKERAMVLP